jgi:hypothetical protein
MCCDWKSSPVYVFIRIKAKKNRYGLLELAHNYCNVAGLCLYTKFGFIEDITIRSTLESKSCFPETNNLPMVCDLDNITMEHLYSALIEGKNVPIEQEPLCKRLPPAKERARMKIRANNYDKMEHIQLTAAADEESFTGKELLKRLSRLSKSGYELTPDMISPLATRSRKTRLPVDNSPSIASASVKRTRVGGRGNKNFSSSRSRSRKGNRKRNRGYFKPLCTRSHLRRLL